MIEYYLPIKHLHWLFVAVSLILFNVRFFLHTYKPDFKNTFWLRMVQHSNDALLLFAGMTMMVITAQIPFVAALWLGFKLLLVLVYIACGFLAMYSEPRSRMAWIFYATAMISAVVIIWLAHCKIAPVCDFTVWV